MIRRLRSRVSNLEYALAEVKLELAGIKQGDKVEIGTDYQNLFGLVPRIDDGIFIELDEQARAVIQDDKYKRHVVPLGAVRLSDG